MLAAAGDIAEIPTVYCYDLKYYVAAYYYARVHDDELQDHDRHVGKRVQEGDHEDGRRARSFQAFP